MTACYELRSRRLFRKHAEELIRQARRHYRKPDADRMVGLIFTRDVFHTPFMRAYCRKVGAARPRRNLAGLVPRAFALNLLRLAAPAGLDWVEPESAPGPKITLALVLFTKDAVQFASVRFSVAPDDLLEGALDHAR